MPTEPKPDLSLRERIARALGWKSRDNTFGLQWLRPGGRETPVFDKDDVLLRGPSGEFLLEEWGYVGSINAPMNWTTDRNTLPQLWAEIERRGFEKQYGCELYELIRPQSHEKISAFGLYFRCATATAEQHCRAFLAAIGEKG